MAKVIWSSMVQSVKGKVRGGIFRGGRSGSVLMDYYRPTSRSERQIAQRSIVGNCSDGWYALTDVQRELWNKYGGSLESPITGVAAYMKANVRLAAADHADLTVISEPPLTPATPEALHGYSASRDEYGNLNATWISPNDANTYVIISVCVGVGYSVTGKESWRRVGTVRSDALSFICALDYALTRPVFFRAYTIDAFGRQSPFVYGSTPFVSTVVYVYVASNSDNALTAFGISDIDEGIITHEAVITGAGAPNYLSGPFAVFATGNYAYVVSYLDNALTAFDISDVENGNIIHKAHISGTGSPNYLGSPYGVFVEGNYAYVASYGNNALSVFDVSDVVNGNIIHKASITGAGAPNYLYGPRGVFVVGNYAFVAAYTDNALSVFDISDVGNGNITHKVSISGAGSPNYLSRPWGVFVSGNYAFVTAYADDALSVFDISDVGNGNITHKASVSSVGAPYYLDGVRGVFVSGNYAYTVGSLAMTLTAFDISDVGNGNITYKAHISGTGPPVYLYRPCSVYVSGNYAYVASLLDDALSVFDISDVGNGNITHKVSIVGAGSPNYLDGAQWVFVG